MFSEDQIPDDKMLARFGAGMLSEDEANACEDYVHESAEAAARLSELSCEDTLVASLRDTKASLQDEEDVVDDLVGKISERLMVDQLHGSTDELVKLLAPPETDDELGRLGNYRILSVIGAGGMGVVFAAEDIELRREVALKAMKPVLAASSFAAQRFQREARAAAAFQHDRIVTIYQVGEDRNIPFFTMQRLDGESLAARLDRQDRLTAGETVALAIQVSEGLAAAHRRGLLHRDIKPDNIWLQSADDSVKILDFGLVRSADNETNLTNSGAILGTPKYMSPEQVNGLDIDQRSDLFSLGTVLYRAVSGQSPFLGGNVVSTLMSVTQDNIVSPQQLQPDTPSALDHLIMRLLEKDPDKRYGSADELLEDLRDIRDGRTLSLPVRSRTAKWYANAMWWGVAAICLLLFGIIVQVQTDRGTLVIQAEPGVMIETGKDGVWIRDKKSGRKLRVSVGKNRLKSGDYAIVVDDPESGWSASSSSFTLRRGDEQRILISLKPGSRGSAVAGGQFDPNGGVARVKPLQIPVDKNLFRIEPGQPLFANALVSNPKHLKGFRSWTWTLAQGEQTLHSLTPNPVIDLIAAGDSSGKIRIWDTKTRQLLHVLPGDTDVQGLCWSPDGKLLVAAHFKQRRRRERGPMASAARIWRIDAESAQLVRELKGNFQRTAWSPDGSRVAFGGDSVIQFLDAKSNEGAMLPNSGIVGSLSSHPWSPDGRQIVTRVVGEGLKIWDVNRQSVFHSITGAAAWNPQWHREGRYLAFFKAANIDSDAEAIRVGKVTFDLEIEIWDTKTLRSTKTIKVAEFADFRLPRRPRNGGTLAPGTIADDIAKVGFAHLQWSPKGNSIASFVDGRLDTWDVVSGKLAKHVGKRDLSGPAAGYRSQWRAPSWGKDGRTIFTLSQRGGAVQWNVDAGSRTWWKKNPLHYILLAATARADKLIVGRMSETEMKTRLAIWDPETQSYPLKTEYVLNQLIRGQSPFEESQLSPDGSRFVTLYVTSADSASRDLRPLFLGQRVKCTVTIHDVASGKIQHKLEIEAPTEPRPEWSPDGKLIAIDSRRSQRLRKYQAIVIDADTGKLRTAESSFEIKRLSAGSRFSALGAMSSNRFASWFPDSQRRIQWHDNGRVFFQNLTNNKVSILMTSAGAKALERQKARSQPPSGRRSPQRSRRSVVEPIPTVQGAVASADGKMIAVVIVSVGRTELGRRSRKDCKVEFWQVSGEEPKLSGTAELKPITAVTRFVFSADSKFLHVVGFEDMDSRMRLAKVDVSTAKAIEPITRLDGAYDQGGLGTLLTPDMILINSLSAGISVFDHHGKRGPTLLVAPTSDESDWPPVLAVTASGDFASEGILWKEFSKSMVFVGLTNDGRIATRRAAVAMAEFGLKNQGVDYKSLLRQVDANNSGSR